METRCPECHTVFRVADEQLAIADGKVRCGECSHVFNARDNAVAGEDKIIEPVSIDVPDIEVKDISIDYEQSTDTPEQTEPAEADTEEPEDSDENTVEADSKDTANEKAEQNDEAVEKDKDDKSGYDVTELYPELQKAPSFQPPPSGRETLTWSVVILLLLGLLFAQLIYFNRDRLATKPKLRPMLESMCEFMDCELAGQRAPALIRLQSHKVLSHPKDKEALRVEAIIINEADFVQAYPLLRLRFRDLDGRLLATRDFLPQDYLPTDVNRKSGMTPGEPVNTVLDIFDPGKKAISYEFDFL